jgi:hypothetical protein
MDTTLIFYSNQFRKDLIMKKLFSTTKQYLSSVDPRIIRLLVTLGSLVLFVLAAGAPDSTGGIGM